MNPRFLVYQRFGECVSLVEDATLDLVRLAGDAWDEGFVDLLADMRIHELGTSRSEDGKGARARDTPSPGQDPLPLCDRQLAQVGYPSGASSEVQWPIRR